MGAAIRARKGFYEGSTIRAYYYEGSVNIGALIIRIGFGVYYTIVIIRNPKTLF